MGAEALQIQIPEQIQKPEAELREAFASAQQAVYKLTADPKLHERLVGKGIDPYADMDKIAYWDTLEEYSSEVVERHSSQSGKSLRLSAFELLAATPAFVLHQYESDAAVRQGRHKARDAQLRFSHFNSLIQNFASTFPDVRASLLESSLLGIVNTSVEHKDAHYAAGSLIHSTVRGAQHELAFGQILDKTGLPFSPSSLEMDVMGVDYIVHAARGRDIFIDVKASLSKMEGRNEFTRPYTRNPEGTIQMFSLIHDSDLRDRFFIEDGLATQRAPVLYELLAEASNTELQTA